VPPAVDESTVDGVPERPECEHLNEEKPKKTRKRRIYFWSELLKRVFAIDVLECPRCFGRMRLIATIHSAEALQKILDCLGLPSRAPPVSPARRSDIASAHVL
jgi:hypothetical protein